MQKLNHNYVSSEYMKMPTVGLGTCLTKPEEIDTAINAAIDAGYRHIDTAFRYANEKDIGNSLKNIIESGKVKREDLFIVTKLPNFGNKAESVELFLKKSLEALQLTYVDLYLIHGPMAFKEPPEENYYVQPELLESDPTTNLIEIWKAMEKQVDAGRTKYIGVSKFNISQLQRILGICRIRPANLQTELHIYLQDNELVSFCKENGITVCAFSPLGSPGFSFWSQLSKLGLKPPTEDRVILEIANKYQKTPVQILLRFLIEYGVAVIPKSINISRIKQNIDVFDFELTKDDFSRITTLDKGDQGRIFGKPFFGAHSLHPEYPFAS